MAHWFDTLARPHTRRTALKSAGLAGAALLLPIRRAPSAYATDKEACYVPCINLAQAVQEQADGVCAKRFGVRSFAESAPYVGGVLTSMRHERWTGCNAVASCSNHEANIRCRFQPDCGDPAQYPNGAAPTPVPVPVPNPNCGVGNYVFCAAQPCCDLSIASCVSCPRGQVCCRNGGGGCCGG
jgi:hypothetical protein